MTKKQDDTIHYYEPSPNAYDRQQKERINKLRKQIDEQGIKTVLESDSDKLKERGITKHKIEGGFYYTDKDGNTIPKPKQ